MEQEKSLPNRPLMREGVHSLTVNSELQTHELQCPRSARGLDVIVDTYQDVISGAPRPAAQD